MSIGEIPLAPQVEIKRDVYVRVEENANVEKKVDIVGLSTLDPTLV